VRDAAGRPLEGIPVTALSASVRTDDAGRYAIHTVSGVQLVASNGDAIATAELGHANVPQELVDLVVR